MKNPNEPIGNRTRDFLANISVLQPTTPLCKIRTEIHLIRYVKCGFHCVDFHEIRASWETYCKEFLC
jgi:hypothetical protein